MKINFEQGPFTKSLWAQVQPIIHEITQLPFLQKLAEGQLDALPFAHYIYQDGLYLTRYAKALALLAASAPQRNESLFWSQASAEAVAAEELMQADVLADAKLAQAHQQLAQQGALKISPTTLGYSSFIIATTATSSHAEGVAAVLPCFWIYAHVGKLLIQQALLLGENHPYKQWVETYDSPQFDNSTRQAVHWLEHHLAHATATTQSKMRQIFEQACIYELHFWAKAHLIESWQLTTQALYAERNEPQP